jgi:hypothetical protein
MAMSRDCRDMTGDYGPFWHGVIRHPRLELAAGMRLRMVATSRLGTDPMIRIAT